MNALEEETAESEASSTRACRTWRGASKRRSQAELRLGSALRSS